MSTTTLKFYPLGNADTTLIKLDDDRHILWDYANTKIEDDDDDKRCDLPSELDDEVDGDFEVVTFTHADDDHIKGFSDYFYLEHAKKYQDDDRKKILELWVPATVLIDNHAKDEAKVLKAEARHRLKEKSGILVFSRPDKMKNWCDEQDDISYDDVKHLFIDAGKTIKKFSKETDGLEIFVHSPFASESQKIDRNSSSIVVQIEFNDKCSTKLILGADCTEEVWKDIIKVTKHFKRNSRLEWDIFHISHHCSYLSLASDKGADTTDPDKEIKWLFETQGNSNSRLISSSKPIPVKGTKEDKDVQPPHRQAANYYKSVKDDKSGEFYTTMEHPSKENPEPLVIEINSESCAKVKKKTKSRSEHIGKAVVPRAGKRWN